MNAIADFSQGFRYAFRMLLKNPGFALIAVFRKIQRRLYKVCPYDPSVYSAVALVLAATSLIACLVPARRAAQVDPTTALRAE